MFGSKPDAERQGLGAVLVFVPKPGASGEVRSGKDYFFIQIHAAQASFRRSILTRATRLIVMSTVSMSRPGLMRESLQSLQHSRMIQPDTAYKLGLRTNLVPLVPAIMTDLSISLAFLLDGEDRLAALDTLINDSSFQSALSFAPAAGAVAKTISGLAQKVVQTFLPSEKRRPILEFTVDLNLASGGISEGYYVCLASQDRETPLPDPLPALEVIDGGLRLAGHAATQHSYLILEVRRTPVRTRDLNDGAPWEAKLREAEDEARLPTNDDATASWTQCRGLIREAQSLLRADPNYLRDEADAIIVAVLTNCASMLNVDLRTRGNEEARTKPVKGPKVGKAELLALSLAPNLDIATTLERYADHSQEARLALRDLTEASCLETAPEAVDRSGAGAPLAG